MNIYNFLNLFGNKNILNCFPQVLENWIASTNLLYSNIDISLWHASLNKAYEMKFGRTPTSKYWTFLLGASLRISSVIVTTFGNYVCQYPIGRTVPISQTHQIVFRIWYINVVIQILLVRALSLNYTEYMDRILGRAYFTDSTSKLVQNIYSTT